MMEDVSKSEEKYENKNNSAKHESDHFNESEEREKIKKQATLLFLQGKRSVFIQDYPAAVATLSESCQLFSQIYPELDDALADPYFYYGKALLEVGRSETEVLGDQVQDEDKENEDEDEDEDEDEGENGNNEDDDNDDVENGDQKAESEENCAVDSNSKENGVVSHEQKSIISGSIKSTGEVTEESKTTGDNTENDENNEINDLQLSWEYLELAKLIYSKKADTCKESAIKLAETFLCLGENGLESENYSIAIEDIKQALELQKKFLTEEDRRIAETYYQMGIAYSLHQNYDEAIESFKNAIRQLEKKISSLEVRKKIGDKKTENEEKDAFYTMDGEIQEIRKIIAEVDEKIKDMMECKKQVKAELVKQFFSDETGAGSSTSSMDSKPSAQASSSSSSSLPATDISHLVRRKRKNDDEETNEEKKTKTEN